MATLPFDGRNINGPVHELLDESRAVVATFGVPEFEALLNERPVAA